MWGQEHLERECLMRCHIAEVLAELASMQAEVVNFPELAPAEEVEEAEVPVLEQEETEETEETET